MEKGIKLSDHFTYGRLLRFTLPSICMMIFTSIYSIVDGFFVSNFAGETPFTAINLIMPFIMIMSTVGLMFGTGGSAIVAKAFGENKKEQANKYFSLFIYVAVALSVVLAILGIVFIEPIARLLGAEPGTPLLHDACQYARIILSVLPFAVLQYMFQSFCVTADKPKLGLVITVLAGVTNIILDAVLVMNLPQEWKLAGAAIATALSQVVGGIVPLVYFSRKNSSLLRLCKTSIDKKAIVRACTNGSSEFMSNISMSIVGILYNLQLLEYAGEQGVAAYGVMMYVSMIFAAAFMGYAIGTAPIISYHFGAQNHIELKGLLRKSLRIIAAFSGGMLLLSEALAKPLAMIFVSYDEKLMELTVGGFRIFAISFAFMGFAIFSSSFFTALNDGLTSALISFLRTLVFQIAAVELLPLLFVHFGGEGINGVWCSIVAAEVMAALFSALFLVLKRNKYKYF